MKYFSLLHGQQVARGTGKKVIPAKEFSKLLSGRSIVTQTQKDAQQYREEVIEECEGIKEEAKLDGFEQGMLEWAEQIRLLQKEIETARDEMQKSLVPVALQAAKKIVGREIALNPDTVADIVGNSLKAVTGHSRVTIYCHKDDFELLSEKKNDFKKLFERLDSLAVVEREDIETGGCIIETEAGIINAQPTQLWRTLESAFEAILKE